MSNTSFEMTQSTSEGVRSRVPHPHLYNAILRTVLRGVIAAHSSVRVEGHDILREQPGPYILAPTHRSMLDIPLIAQVADQTAQTQLHFMGKDSLWRLPMAGSLFEALGGFSVDRKKSLSTETIDHIGSIFEKNGVICIFPEGTRKHGNVVGKIKTGTVRLAAHYDVPVVPAGIAGTEKNNRGQFAVVIGEPLNFSEHSISQGYDSGAARTAIAAIRNDAQELRRAMQQTQDAAIELAGQARI